MNLKHLADLQLAALIMQEQIDIEDIGAYPKEILEALYCEIVFNNNQNIKEN